MPQKNQASSFRFLLFLIPSVHHPHFQKHNDRSYRCSGCTLHCNVRSRLFPYFL
jgi:hypothetical protein